MLEDSNKIMRKYGYFWFILNEPDEYDKWKYKTSKEYFRRYEGRTLDDKIPYYRDPYVRLEGQHKTVSELSTGLTYTSQWPI
ncbi:hypothetical protein MUP77_01840 [Candidatus Bathyarchaeota archaeon]|nr:hypothetical protein [Candidatus Bathyarchaeota archaeon]